MLSGLRRSEMLTAVLIFVLLLGVTPVFAGVQGGANSCAADEAGISLNCTAEDVRVASVDLLDVVDGCTAVGDTAVAKMLLNLEINAAQRYDMAGMRRAEVASRNICPCRWSRVRRMRTCRRAMAPTGREARMVTNVVMRSRTILRSIR